MARWKFIFTYALKGFGTDRCTSLAAAIAYYALLSIFPLVIFAIGLAGFFLHNDTGAQERVITGILNNLPLSEDTGRADLQRTIQDVASKRGTAGLIGLIGTAYSASALFGALRTSMSVVFRVNRERPPVISKLLDLGMVVGLGTLILLSLVLTAVIAYAQKFSGELFGSEVAALAKVGFTVLYFILPAVVSGAVFMVLYKVVPHADLPWRHALPGAIVAAVGFEALKIGFAQYVANFGNYNAVYGTLGFVIVFLFFAYLSGQLLLFGAEFTRAYAEVVTGTVPAAKPAVPKRKVSIPQRAMSMAKGLFVTKDPHHDHSLPYEPARKGGPPTDSQGEQRL